MGELNNSIEEVINGLREFCDGNPEYQELFETVVKALDEFKRTQASNDMTTRLIFLMSKISTLLKCPGLLFESNYRTTQQCIKEDLRYYRYVQSILNSYLRESHKNHEFTNIDMWYLLYLNLASLFNQITDYPKYIRLLELGYIRGYTIDQESRSEALIANKETIDEILKLLQIKKED